MPKPLKNISHKVFEAIKEQHMAPKPRWQFIVWRSFLWFIVILTIVIGSIGMSMLLEELITTEWDLTYQLTDNLTSWLILFFPYIWLLLLIITLLLVSKVFAATTHGYRYKPLLIVGVAIICSLTGGFLLHRVGNTLPLKDKVQMYIKPYAELQKKREEVFVAPQRGILSGSITKISTSEFILKDYLGKDWVVRIKTFKNPSNMLIVGKRVIILGHQVSNNTFEAKYIRLWRSPSPRAPIIIINKNKMKELPHTLRIYIKNLP